MLTLVEGRNKMKKNLFYNIDPHTDDVTVYVYLNIGGKNRGKIVEI